MSSRTPKEIGRLAGRIFQRAIPASWAVRSQEDQEDYGVDFEVELTTPTDNATGFIFKVQVKGAEEATLIDGGSTVSFSGLPTTKLRYYLRQLRIPIVFVVVDLAQERISWIPLQGNPNVEARFEQAVANGHDKLTLHLPVTNSLPTTSQQLLNGVRQMMNHLTVTGLKNLPSSDLGALIDSGHSLEDLDRSLRLAHSVVRSRKTQRLIDEGKLPDAFKLNQKAFIDDDEPVEARFSAGMEVVRIASGIAATDAGPDSDPEGLLRLRHSVSSRLVALTSKLDPFNHLRHYSLFLARNARMRVLVYQDTGVFMSRRAHQPDLDEYMRLVATGAQQRTTNAITSELRNAQRRIFELIRGKWFHLVIHAWSELTETLGPFMFRLRMDGLADGANAIRALLDGIGALCRDVAASVTDLNVIGLCALNHIRIGAGTDTIERRVAEVEKLTDRVPSVADREMIRSRQRSLVQFLAEQSWSDDADVEQDPPDANAIESTIRQMARSLGVDLDDPNDHTADVLRIGIRDFNPERVLRECQHLYIQIDNYGIPAQMFGLPTAGFKSVRCTKHAFRIGALYLDDAYALFKQNHCARCKDCEPHSATWKWTLRYQAAEDEKHGL